MRASKRLFPALMLLVLIAPLRAQTPLRVAAAADLEPVLPPILDQFQRATGLRSEATYQASAMLATEIENGAPFDLFLSADLGYPKRLIDLGLADAAALRSLNLYDALKPRLVTAENTSQAAQFVDSANADAGLISLTSALTPRLTADGLYFVIPRNLYPPIEQGAVIVGSTKQRAAVHKLLDFLLSAPVQAQLAKSGLTPVK
ncbi:MAG: molybdate ABC transporter substrate-binding protein [Terracidiphilus sp.]